MKFSLGLVVFVAVSLFSYGQGRPRTSQYIFNNYLFNPAVSGIDNYIDVKPPAS